MFCMQKIHCGLTQSFREFVTYLFSQAVIRSQKLNISHTAEPIKGLERPITLGIRPVTFLHSAKKKMAARPLKFETPRDSPLFSQ